MERRETIEDIGDQADDMVLGFLNVYSDVYGEGSLDKLLAEI